MCVQLSEREKEGWKKPQRDEKRKKEIGVRRNAFFSALFFNRFFFKLILSFFSPPYLHIFLYLILISLENVNRRNKRDD